MNTSPREYYENHQFLYNWFWSRTALHYGLWDDQHRTLARAIENTNNVIAQQLAINQDDRVLDLGSGTGGTAVQIAKNYSCSVTGITISLRQKSQAEGNAKKTSTDDHVTFEHGNFDQPLNFDDQSFTKITAIESFCYANDKQEVLKELFRVLAPGGKIAIDDGYLSHDNLSVAEQRIYDICRRGWQVASLVTVESLRTMLTKAGFRNITWTEYTKNIYPSSKRIKLIGYCLIVPSYVLSLIHPKFTQFRHNAECMIAQRKIFPRIARYGIVTAQK